MLPKGVNNISNVTKKVAKNITNVGKRWQMLQKVVKTCQILYEFKTVPLTKDLNSVVKVQIFLTFYLKHSVGTH